jgi:hypothetical protein
MVHRCSLLLELSWVVLPVRTRCLPLLSNPPLLLPCLDSAIRIPCLRAKILPICIAADGDLVFGSFFALDCPKLRYLVCGLLVENIVVNFGDAVAAGDGADVNGHVG